MMIVINIVYGFDGLYGQDSYEYLRYTNAISDWYAGGEHPGDFFWPVLYPLFASWLGWFMESGLALQLISLMALMGNLILVRKMLELLYPEKLEARLLNAFIIVAMIASPYFLRAGIIVMSDMLAAFFVTFTMFSCIKSVKEEHWSGTVLAFFAASLSVMTRYPTAILVGPAILFLIGLQVKRKHLFWLVLATVVGVVGLLPFFIVKGGGVNQFFAHDGLQRWSPVNFTSTRFATADGFNEHDYPNWLYALSPFFHPGYLSMGIPLLFFTRPRKLGGVLLLLFLIVGFYLLFLAGIPFQNMRMFIPVFPLCVVLFYPAFYRGAKKFKPVVFFVGIVVILGVQSFLFVDSFNRFVQTHHLEKEVASKIQQISTPEVPVYAFVVDIALPYRGVDNQVRSLWEANYDDFEKGALVVFNEPLLSPQWSGENPMLNWQKLKEQHKLHVVAECAGGWKIYRIHD